MKNLFKLALCSLALSVSLAACSNDPTVENGGSSTNGANVTFIQIDRVGRPGLKELYLPYATHDAFNRITASADTTSGPAVATFVSGTGTRSSDIAAYDQALLSPDALVANLNDTSGRASYLGWETGAGIAADCTGLAPTPFGGRALNDDVVNVMLGLTFGNLATVSNPTTPTATPGLAITRAADDGREQNGLNGTPNLTNQNVSCAGKGYQTGTFPYLAAPL